MSTTAPTLYQPNSNLRTPYTMQSGLTLERQLTKSANLSLTYLNARGVHQFFTENINAPLCSTLPCDPATAPHPLGNSANVYQYQSEGIFRQQQLIINSSIRMGTKLSLFGYTLNYANSDASGAELFLRHKTTSASIMAALLLTCATEFFWRQHGLALQFPAEPFLVAQSGVPTTSPPGRT